MVTIRRLTERDIPALLRLKEQAGWNQLEADIRRYLELEPEGCFAAEHEGLVVGTTTTCVLGSVAWVAMVLVEPALRRHGIGTALMEHALAYLDKLGLRTIRLDATPLGQPVYERLGFVAEYSLARWQGIMPAISLSSHVEPVREDDLDEVIQLDTAIIGTDRGKLLRRLHQEDPSSLRLLRHDGKLVGYAGSRPGAKAAQVGPCLASDSAGPPLLADAAGRWEGQMVYWDVPIGHTAAEKLAESWGLSVQRQLLRMVRGVPKREHVQSLWASSGPEMG